MSATRVRGATAPSREFGGRVRDRRKERGHSQRQLASALGVSATAVQAWEHGRAGITHDNLATLAGVLRCDPDWLLNGDPDTDRVTKLERRVDQLVARVAALETTGKENPTP